MTGCPFLRVKVLFGSCWSLPIWFFYYSSTGSWGPEQVGGLCVPHRKVVLRESSLNPLDSAARVTGEASIWWRQWYLFHGSVTPPAMVTQPTEAIFPIALQKMGRLMAHTASPQANQLCNPIRKVHRTHSSVISVNQRLPVLPLASLSLLLQRSFTCETENYYRFFPFVQSQLLFLPQFCKELGLTAKQRNMRFRTGCRHAGL